MNLNEIALNQKILEIKVGSHLYGTNTENSDIDFSGIFVAPKSFYLGLSSVAEVDMSVVSKQSNGKNDKNAIDRKFYELRKFIKLASDNNPNILEHLFVNYDNILFCNDIGNKLINARHIFPYKGLYNKFIGYSFSQRKKMIIKKGNMEDIILGLEFFNKIPEPSKKYVVQFKKHILEYGFQTVNDTGQHILIGDVSIQKNNTIKQAIRKLEDRRNKFSSRYDEYVSKSGYDTKFGSNLIRLLYEGKELLSTGEIQFPLKEKDLILDIKEGKYSLTEVLEMGDGLEDDLRLALEKSDLPKKPQIDKIEKLLIELIEESWENESKSNL